WTMSTLRASNCARRTTGCSTARRSTRRCTCGWTSRDAMKYVEIAFGGLRLRARLLDERAPAAAVALWNALPLEGRAFQDQYSSQLMRITSRLDVDSTGDRRYGYQQRGLLLPDPTSGRLAVGFG